jgi:hypothetical protein
MNALSPCQALLILALAACFLFLAERERRK